MLRSPLLVALIATLVGCNKPRTQPNPEPPAPVEAPEPATEPPVTAPPADDEPTPPPLSNAVQKERPPPLSNAVQKERPPAPATDVTLLALVAPSVHTAVRAAAAAYSRETGVKVTVRAAEMIDSLKRMADGGADVIIPEGHMWLEVLRGAKLMEEATLRVVAYLPLTVTVAGQKAGELRTLNDIDSEGVRLGIPDPSRSTGAEAARRLFGRAQLGEKLQERVLRSGAASALRDGTVDAFAGWGRLDIGVPLALPLHHQNHLAIPAVATNITEAPEAAAAFVTWLASPAAAKAWTEGGALATLPADAAITPTVFPVTLPGPRRHAASTVIGQRILVVGGESGGALVKRLTWFEPARVAAYDAKAQLPLGTQGPAIVWSKAQRRVFILGGKYSTGPTADIQRWEPDAERVEQLNIALPEPVWGAAAVLDGDAILIFGGWGRGELEPLRSIVRIELGVGEVQTLRTRLPTGRAHMGVGQAADGTVWLLGGEQRGGPTDEILAFSPQTQAAVQIKPRLPRPVSGLSVAEWDGGWLLMGGRERQASLDHVWKMDPEGNTSVTASRLPHPLYASTAERLGQNVYIFGGLGLDRVENRVVRLPY